MVEQNIAKMTADELRTEIKSYRTAYTQALKNAMIPEWHYKWINETLDHTSLALERLGETLKEYGEEYAPRIKQVYEFERENHSDAFKYVLEAAKNNEELTPQLILKVHHEILKKIYPYDEHAGSLRNDNVRSSGIGGIHYPDYSKLPELLDTMVEESNKLKDKPVRQAIDLHLRMTEAHLFHDGNGRVSRLMMNFILLKSDYPPLFIEPDSKKDYITSLRGVRVDSEDRGEYELFMMKQWAKSIIQCLKRLGEEPQKIIDQVHPVRVGQHSGVQGEAVKKNQENEHI